MENLNQRSLRVLRGSSGSSGESRKGIKQILFFVLILLLGIELGVEPRTTPVLLHKLSGQKSAESHPTPAPNPSEKRPERMMRMKLKSLSPLDRDAFLLSFERQAARDLIPCLLAETGASGSLSLLARLHKQGSLTSIRALGAPAPLPECAVRAVEAMHFDTISARLTSDSLEIQWRFDY